MRFEFRKATRKQAKARVGLFGPSGSGKTYTLLVIASQLGQNIFLLDSENRSADHYGDEFDFSKCDLPNFSPKTFREAIRAAEDAGADVIIVDSLSHAWAGEGGALEMVDDAMIRSGGNKWAAWREVTPEHNKLVNSIVGCRCHIICTMRSKTVWEVTKDDRGKAVPVKIGLAPVQRDGMEYEFDLVADLDESHTLSVTKSRIRTLDRMVVKQPGPEFGQKIAVWLSEGEESPLLPRFAHPDEVQEVWKWAISQGFKKSELQVVMQQTLGRVQFGDCTEDELEAFKDGVERAAALRTESTNGNTAAVAG